MEEGGRGEISLSRKGMVTVGWWVLNSEWVKFFGIGMTLDFFPAVVAIWIPPAER